MDTPEPCCSRIALVSRGSASENQPARLGTYRATALKNGRYYYSKEDSNQATSYIYYWDWGPNAGANWVVTNNPNDGTSRGIESANVEYGAVNRTICLNEARQAGEFLVFNSRTGSWENDRSLRVLCDPN